MSEIVIASDWRTRLEELVGSKRQTVLLVAALVAAAVTGIIMVGGRAPARVAPPARAPASAAYPAPTQTIPSTLFVHVSGAVASPGLFELMAGTRVADAIALAGGAIGDADVDSLNLAELLVDGAKVHVPVVGEQVPSVTSIGATPSTATIVDINAADVAALETIPGIGPTRAAAIVAYRDEVGGFRSVDQLLEVNGIGPATLESMREYVTV